MKKIILTALIFLISGILHSNPREVSIIIPVLNEETNITSLIYNLKTLEPTPKLIFVDGGSKDTTIAQIEQSGEKVVHVTNPNRGKQMNKGIAEADGEILLFFHADCRLSQEAYSAMLKTLEEPYIYGGAFSYSLEGSDTIPGLRAIEWGVWLRNKIFHMPYGDQGFFIKREALAQIGSFKELPLMEDVEWFDRLKSSGRYVILNNPITTSPRRILRKGLFKSCMVNNTLITLYYLGFNPETLAQIYYRK